MPKPVIEVDVTTVVLVLALLFVIDLVLRAFPQVISQ